MKSRPLISKARAVRVADEHYTRMEKMADDGRKEGVSITGITDLALRQFFDRLDNKEADPALTPMTPAEAEAVRMILAVARQPDNRPEESAMKLLSDLYALRFKKPA